MGKTALTKVLQSLVDKEDIIAKAYGKQTVYVVPQEHLPTPSAEELDAFDAQLKAAKEELAQEKDKTRTLQATLSALQNSLTSEEMQARIASLESENARAARKLEELRSGGRKVDPAEKAKVDKDYDKWSKDVKARKKMVRQCTPAQAHPASASTCSTFLPSRPAASPRPSWYRPPRGDSSHLAAV